ncbi:MAG: hypothetical protein N4A70_16830 [Pelagimonas sp.]|nr:hypothetical protein [Pelagimonas sp.]
MTKRIRRIFTISLAILLPVFLIGRCVPEKEVDLASKITPVQWISEDELLVRLDNEYFLYDQNGNLTPSKFDAAGTNVAKPLSIQMTPRSSSQIWSEEVHSGETHLRTDQYVEIDGDKHQVRKPWLRGRFVGFNQGLPKGEFLDFYTFLHMGKVGLVTFANASVQKVELPLQNDDNLSSPVLKRDSVTGQFFAFQTMCLRDDPDGTCTRTAWWLDANLQVLSSFLLPNDDPLFVKEKFACFSCGCGCYTQEDVYVVNGEAFFLYSGFPLPNSQRGLYRVADFGEGSTEWVHEIKGRIEPPLAFSPSGCKVAYFRVSRFGDSLQFRNLCQ